MDAGDFRVLENCPIILWPLITKLIQEKAKYEAELENEAKKAELIKKKYMEVIEKQEKVLAELESQ